jgi:hypothetical protein
MWRLWNKIFGWDYIAWRNTADKGIARINKGYNDECWYFRYKITRVIDIVTNKDQVVWLTCEPKKYLATESSQ